MHFFAMASSILRVCIKKCSHIAGGNELRPFANGMSVRDICTIYHPPLDKPKASQTQTTAKPDFIVVGRKEEKQEGMSLYDTVLVGDLSKFGIKYVDIECKPDDDLEEMKSVVKETTKKAVCAFELLMSKGRSFPMKRKSSAGQKEGVLNSKDRLYNDIVDYLTESKLDFTKSVAETQGAYFVQDFLASHNASTNQNAGELNWFVAKTFAREHHLYKDSSKRKYVVCKMVQKGDWSGLVDYKHVPMLSSKNKDAKVLDVKTVTHNSQKRKLVLLEDGTVYKIKTSKLEDQVSPGLTLP